MHVRKWGQEELMRLCCLEKERDNGIVAGLAFAQKRKEVVTEQIVGLNPLLVARR